MHNMINFNGLTTNEVVARVWYWRGTGEISPGCHGIAEPLCDFC